MSNESLIINTEELSDVVKKIDEIITNIEKCSSDFFKEITNISSSNEFQGYTADNLKMFSDKFTTTTRKEISEVTGEVKKNICKEDGYIDRIVLHDHIRK